MSCHGVQYGWHQHVVYKLDLRLQSSTARISFIKPDVHSGCVACTNNGKLIC